MPWCSLRFSRYNGAGLETLREPAEAAPPTRTQASRNGCPTRDLRAACGLPLAGDTSWSSPTRC